MKILVTGGAGFIGSHLTRRLLSLGKEVVVLDNFSSGKHENIAGLPVRVIDGDIRDKASVAQAVQNVDTVFHQAALCSVARSMEDPALTMEVNVTGTMNVLDASRKAGVRRVVMASSSSVYGDSDVFPKREEMKTDPISPYALSKLIGELYCHMYWKRYALETVALRYFNVFGPRQDPLSEYSAVIPKFFQAILQGAEPQIYGDGTQSRDFTFVDDVVEANIAASESQSAAGRIMNIACGNRWSLLQLIHHLENILNCTTRPVFLPARPGDVQHSQAGIERASQLINFKPSVEFKEGLRETAAWFLERHGTSRPSVIAAVQSPANVRAW